jgi:hypothetical protein
LIILIILGEEYKLWHKSPLLVPILSHMNPVHSLPTSSSYLRPSLQNSIFCSGVQTKLCVHSPPLPWVLHVLPISSPFILSSWFDWEYKFRRSSVWSFLHPPAPSIQLRPQLNAGTSNTETGVRLIFFQILRLLLSLLQDIQDVCIIIHFYWTYICYILCLRWNYFPYNFHHFAKCWTCTVVNLHGNLRDWLTVQVGDLQYLWPSLLCKLFCATSRSTLTMVTEKISGKLVFNSIVAWLITPKEYFSTFIRRGNFKSYNVEKCS